MARNTRIYSDFDLNFLANPATKDVGMKYDANAIKAAVKNLVLTQNFERPFQSAIGTQVYSLLFNPPGPMLDALLARAIKDVINTYEPRVVLLEVLVNSQVDSNSVDVAITFRIVNTPLPITLELILKRTR